MKNRDYSRGCHLRQNHRRRQSNGTEGCEKEREGSGGREEGRGEGEKGGTNSSPPTKKSPFFRDFLDLSEKTLSETPEGSGRGAGTESAPTEG